MLKKKIVRAFGNTYYLFGKDEECVIPWDAIRNIGDDIVLVEDSACHFPQKRRKWNGDIG